MKSFKARFLALCGLMVLVSTSVAPLVASAQTCPTLKLECGGKIRSCAGTVNGDKCDYDRACVNCSSGGDDELLIE
jgi:hypothetical protein